MLILLLKKISYSALLIFLLSIFSFLFIYFYTQSTDGFWIRYINFISKCINEMILTQEPKKELLLTFFLPTIKLFFSVIFVMFFIGLPLGICFGLVRNKTIHSISHLVLLLCYSTPILFLGILVFIQLLPQYRYYLISLEKYYDTRDFLYYFNLIHENIANRTLYNYFLPVCILSVQSCAITIQTVAKNVQNVINLYFIKFERVQNNSNYNLIVRHLIPNIIPKTIDQILNYTAMILFCTISIELIFNLKGVGRLIYHVFLVKDIEIISVLILCAGTFISIFLFACQILTWIFFPAERRKLS